MILALDTATARAVVALGASTGPVARSTAWMAGYRHGEELLARIDGLLVAEGIGLDDLTGIVVGTGPGAFTGLRVGLAVAKTLAHELRIPLAGVSTADALRDAVVAGRSVAAAPGGGDADPVPRLDAIVVVLPAGPSSVYVADDDGPRLVLDRSAVAFASGTTAVAIDLPVEEFGEAACERGTAAIDGLGEALLRRGGARLLVGAGDDPAMLVPDYVALPRGAAGAEGEVAWSRDPR